MTSRDLQAQAAELTTLIPSVMRRLFSVENDPVADLPIAQLRLCAVLQDGPKLMSAASEELGISLSATCQLADRLEKAGMVERLCESGDRRVKCLQMTSHGETVMRDRRRSRVQRTEEVLSRLTPSERDKIVSALQALLDASHVVPGQEGSTRPGA